MNNLSRRSLIRGAAVLPAAGLGLVSTADASSSSKPKFDEIYDVVIIGSGFSGLAAALAAREAGASAAVFEKWLSWAATPRFRAACLPYRARACRKSRASRTLPKH